MFTGDIKDRSIRSRDRIGDDDDQSTTSPTTSAAEIVAVSCAAP
jgi:hypothetical protein